MLILTPVGPLEVTPATGAYGTLEVVAYRMSDLQAIFPGTRPAIAQRHGRTAFTLQVPRRDLGRILGRRQRKHLRGVRDGGCAHHPEGTMIHVERSGVHWLAPVARAMSPHFVVSLATKSANSFGLMRSASLPIEASLCRSESDLSIRLTSAWILSTIAAGSPAGPASPFQV